MIPFSPVLSLSLSLQREFQSTHWLHPPPPLTPLNAPMHRTCGISAGGHKEDAAATRRDLTHPANKNMPLSFEYSIFVVDYGAAATNSSDAPSAFCRLPSLLCPLSSRLSSFTLLPRRPLRIFAFLVSPISLGTSPPETQYFQFNGFSFASDRDRPLACLPLFGLFIMTLFNKMETNLLQQLHCCRN